MPNIPLHHIDKDEITEQRIFSWVFWTTSDDRYLWKPKTPVPKWARRDRFLDQSLSDEPSSINETPEDTLIEVAWVWINFQEQLGITSPTEKRVNQVRGVVFNTLVAYRELSPNIIKIPAIQTQIVEITKWERHPRIIAIQHELSEYLEQEVCLYSCIELWNDNREIIKCIYRGRLWDIYDPNETEVDYLSLNEYGVTYVLHFPESYWERVATIKYGVVRDVGILTQLDTPPKYALFTEEFRLPIKPPKSNLSTLNISQNQALAFAKDIDRYPVVFIHGPSGTGKTETVGRIIQAHLREGRNVCVLSHSNKWFQIPLQKLTQIDPKVVSKIGIYAYSTHIHPNLSWNIIPRRFDWIQSDEKVIKRNLWTEQRKSYATSYYSAYRYQEDVYGYEVWKNQNGLRYSSHVIWLTFDTLQFAWEIQKWDFDVVVVDEATRMQAPELIRALQLAKKQIIFVGDPLQLGNIGISRNSIGHIHPSLVRIFEKWPFSLFIQDTESPAQNLPYVFLDTNYRSRPNLTAIVSGLIYNGLLKSGSKLEDGEAIWYDTSSLATSNEKKDGTSRVNPTEAKLVVNKLLHLIKKWDIHPKDIGIIATYKAQADRIKRLLEKKLAFTTQENKRLYEDIIKNIGTVDSFQWDERKVVIISLTRSNSDGKVGFLSNEARIGVALWRAQDVMYVYGDVSTLTAEKDKTSQFFDKMKVLFSEHWKVVSLQNKS